MESEVGEHPDDLLDVKSVLTALGFKTKAAVASIKTAKQISNLESDYMKMIRNNDAAEMHSRFPSLKFISCFSPGLKSMLFQIVSHLNRVSKCKSFEDDLKKNIVAMGKKVCFPFKF